MAKEYRDKIVELVKSEFIGPCPEENPLENGEEVIERRSDSDSPLARYSVAILYPHMSIAEEAPRTYDKGGDDADGAHEDDDRPAILNIDHQDSTADDDPNDDPVGLSNAYHQSAVSITLRIDSCCSELIVSISFATYAKSQVREGGRTVTKYSRRPHNSEVTVPANALPGPRKQTTRAISCAGCAIDVQLTVTSRETRDPRTKGMYTFSLVNATDAGGRTNDESCAFQVEMCVRSDKPLAPILDTSMSPSGDQDHLNNQLLYRDVLTYGIGHGCAASWDQTSRAVHEVKTSFIPTYEVRPIVPGASNLVFDMLEMSNPDNRAETVGSMDTLCDSYEGWIKEVEREAVDLAPELTPTAQSNIGECRVCLNRMRDGVNLLKTDDTTFQAFSLMNEAMLSQQLHYRMPLSRWEGGKNGGYPSFTSEPFAHDPSSWPKGGVFGRWRTFQIAFILMNLRSMRDESSEDRKMVDLVWFPTGGGKTEAYLGLTAFTLFARRIMDRDSAGVTAIMRYTLRLLTTQQFERASSLICACEEIRERMPGVLGGERFSIGLWVGQSTSPNTQREAVSQLQRMQSKDSSANPFILLKCPWCGAQMGIVDTKVGKRVERVVPGYESAPATHGRWRQRHFRYACSNPKCHFSTYQGNSLPIYAIDEDIYSKKPSLVIGTVDKFAAIATTPETRNLFGRGRTKFSPPDLIIQDELHLISGPLGSMVGFYETAVDVLCTDKAGNKAKIVGSTATISHAKEQCSALYCRERDSIKQFPPSGIDAKDSFFAVEEPDKEKRGRLYVGICAPGNSTAMSLINLDATLLMAHGIYEGSIDSSILDGYVTNLAYFNSLRELGQAATWISGNILENLKAMQKRRWLKDKGFNGRKPWSITSCELTSRIPSNEIPQSLKRLESSYDGNPAQSNAVDICLATNMISVGVDIPRLALMTIDGQPKTTSEYIQASSRVGRGSNPGLVFTVYSPSKPRDKSHYEDFQRYHSRLYCSVEPTSITPFSAPLRDRALKALFVALVRQLCPVEDQDDPTSPGDALFQVVKDIIVSRATKVDPNEVPSTAAQIEKLISEWKGMRPQAYMSKASDEIAPLIMRVDSKINPCWQSEKIWEVPSSMRNVDANCLVKQLPGEYYGGDADA